MDDMLCQCLNDEDYIVTNARNVLYDDDGFITFNEPNIHRKHKIIQLGVKGFKSDHERIKASLETAAALRKKYKKAEAKPENKPQHGFESDCGLEDPTEATGTGERSSKNESQHCFESDCGLEDPPEATGTGERSLKNESQHCFERDCGLEDPPEATGTAERSSKNESQHSTYRRKKLNFCPFCEKWVTNFARHVLKHEDKEEIKSLKNLNKDERSALFTKLRYLGAKVYNESKNPHDLLYVPRGSSSVPRFPCPFCSIMLKKTSMSKHKMRCGAKASGSEPVAHTSAESKEHSMNPRKDFCDKTGMLITSSGVVPLKTEPDEEVLRILSKMRLGPIHDFIINSNTIIDYANLLVNKYVTERHLDDLVRKKLRIIVEVFLEMKKRNDKLQEIEDMFNPEFWSCFIEAIKNRAGWDEKNKTFRAPTTVRLINIESSNFSQHLISLGILKKDHDLVKMVEDWRRVKDHRYKYEL